MNWLKQQQAGYNFDYLISIFFKEITNYIKAKNQLIIKLLIFSCL
jgi:hypothetical protein